MHRMFLLTLVMLASIAAASAASDSSDGSRGLDSLIFADGLDRSPADFAGQSVFVMTFNGKC